MADKNTVTRVGTLDDKLELKPHPKGDILKGYLKTPHRNYYVSTRDESIRQYLGQSVAITGPVEEDRMGTNGRTYSTIWGYEFAPPDSVARPASAPASGAAPAVGGDAKDRVIFVSAILKSALEGGALKELAHLAQWSSRACALHEQILGWTPQPSAPSRPEPDPRMAQSQDDAHAAYEDEFNDDIPF